MLETTRVVGVTGYEPPPTFALDRAEDPRNLVVEQPGDLGLEGGRRSGPEVPLPTFVAGDKPPGLSPAPGEKQRKTEAGLVSLSRHHFHGTAVRL